MRPSHLALVAAAVAVCAMPFAASAASTPSPKPVPATVQTVVRPVTASGQPSDGYRVTTLGRKDAIDCSYRSASVAAVDKDIISCSPDAAYAVACWRSASAHHVLCLNQADTRKLNDFPVTGRIAHAAAPKKPAPLDMKLANGVFCGLRNGGAGTELRQHTSWYATYYCTGNNAVWAPHGFGIHRDGRVWTVELASASGKRHVHTVRVARAWFMGTAA